MEKSCINCKYGHYYNYPGTLEDPPDEGVECRHPNEMLSATKPDPNCPQCHGTGTNPKTDQDCDCLDPTPVNLARNCEGYEYQPPEPEPPEDHIAEASYQEYLKSDTYQEELQQELRDREYLNSDGTLNDRFFQDADFAYDCYRKPR